MRHRTVGGFVLFFVLICCGSLYADNYLIHPTNKSGNEKELQWPSGGVEKRTLYVAHWTHTPENCPGRSANGAKMLSTFWEQRKKAEEKGIKILGAYVTVTEHDYFIIAEANDYAAMVEFFIPLIPNQTGKIVPVLTMDDWLKIMPK